MFHFVLRRLFSKVVHHPEAPPCEVTFADGSKLTNCATGAAELVIHFKTRSAQRRAALFFPDGFFDAYIDEGIDLYGENPIEQIAGLGHKLGFASSSAGGKGRGVLQRFAGYLFAPGPLARVRMLWNESVHNNVNKQVADSNADFHYNLPPVLFESMLGDTVGYSEGYWLDGVQSINQAKHNLYEYICRKLDLQPGMRVMEVGAGWGFLAIYMAKRFDVEVVIYNPAEVQNEYMQERFEQHGVADKITLIYGTHRDILQEDEGSFDRFVSIGVHEHHGYDTKMYRLWWDSIQHVLVEGGIGVVSCSSYMSYRHTGYLTLKYIWPGGHIPSVPMELTALHDAGLTLVEWENAWPDYRRTIQLWRDNFKAQWDTIQASDPQVFTEQFRRRWTMYLEAVPQNFITRGLDCAHFTVVKGRDPHQYPKPLWQRVEGADFRRHDDFVESYVKRV